MNKNVYAKFEKYFWLTFFTLPLVVGIVRYNWLALEPYVGRPNQPVTKGSELTIPNYESPDAIVMRKLKGQDEATNNKNFIHDRYLEVFQYSAIAFIYGLIGCVFFSYGQVSKGKEKNFIVAFAKSLIIAVLTSIFFVICTL